MSSPPLIAGPITNDESENITILAVIAYFGSWAILHGLWRRQDAVLRPILIAVAILTALGILGTFPIFFQAFASE